jgi:hypothetical protein
MFTKKISIKMVSILLALCIITGSIPVFAYDLNNVTLFPDASITTKGYNIKENGFIVEDEKYFK